MEWKLNSQEWDALFDLQSDAVKVYVMGIRPYMNYATGIVGIKRKFSYQSLSELLSIPAERGTQGNRVTKDKIKWVMKKLEKAGLITRIENSWFKIKLNLASQDESVQMNHTRITPGPTPELHPQKNINNQDSYVKEDSELHMYNSPNHTTPPENRLYTNNIINTYTSSSPPVDVNADAPADNTVTNIFEHWKLKLNHPRAVLDDNRKRCITKAMRLGYTEEALCDAIDGCSASPFHIGKNPQNTKYDDLTLILRDASKIESFIEFKTNPPREQNGAAKNGKSGKHDWYYEKQIESIQQAKRKAGFG